MTAFNFREELGKGLGAAVIVAGSDSDKGHIDLLVTELGKYRLPYEVRICSAHKQLEDVSNLLKEYNVLGFPLVIVSVAGGTDALSGTLSYNSFFPVVSCPPDGLNESCLTNPHGSSNAYILRPANVARYIAQTFSFINPELRVMLNAEITGKIEKLRAADSKLRADYAARQGE